jgi:tRNA (cmo5U34)-methyltransferase
MLNSESFEINRWHSAEYVQSWMSNQTREAERRILRKKLVSLLPFEPADAIQVLDVGAGTGELSLEILGKYPNSQLVCHDFSDTMLAQARQKLAQFNGRVTCIKSDLRNPAWMQAVEGTFDSVVSTLVMHTVPERVREIYHEIFALVNPGGCFLSGDHVAPPGPILERVYARAQLAKYQARIKAETGIDKSLREVEQELQKRRQRQPASPDRARRRTAGAFTLTDHLEWLKQSGFNEVDCLWKDVRRAVIGGFRH